ncbi:hypothetical protein TNCV_3429231 [Trichonephila clavipes]|nr:hypothetical protein TNCV_3429231 [Trichonephila clavipes]
MWIEKNSVVIWKEGKSLTVNIDQGKRKRRSSGSSSTLHSELQHLELARREKKYLQEKRNLLKRSPPSLLLDGRNAKRRPLERLIWEKKRTAPPSLFTDKEETQGMLQQGRFEIQRRIINRQAGASKRQEDPGRTSPYPLRSGAGSRRRGSNNEKGPTICIDERIPGNQGLPQQPKGSSRRSSSQSTPTKDRPASRFKFDKPCYRSPMAEWFVHRSTTPQVRGSSPEMGKVDLAFHPFRGPINELNTGGFTSD